MWKNPLNMFSLGLNFKFNMSPGGLILRASFFLDIVGLYTVIARDECLIAR